VKLASVPLALALVTAACGSDDSGSSTTQAPDGTEAADSADAANASSGDLEGALAGVCPDTVVIQTDWFPEAEYSATYELIGDDYTVDAQKKTVSGTLVASGGIDTGVQVEVRSGGPAIGFSPVHSTMYTDTDITLGFTSLDASATFYDDQPTIAVVAPLDKNPQIIMWDPETYPDATSIADLSDQGVTMNVFVGNAYMDVLVNEGIVEGSLVDPSYDGSPARFIAEEGAIAQQGFASTEPYAYQNDFAEWAKPVAYELIHDAGFEGYAQPLGIRSGALDELRPCLELLVPIIQQAAVDSLNSPERSRALIVDAVLQMDDFWVYDEGVATYAIETMRELGLVSNGPDGTIGNFDIDRVQKVIDQMVIVDLAPSGLTADDIVSNEFIDPSIGL
jgi:hypothetical protein